jgi:hypothetical protein
MNLNTCESCRWAEWDETKLLWVPVHEGVTYGQCQPLSQLPPANITRDRPICALYQMLADTSADMVEDEEEPEAEYDPEDEEKWAAAGARARAGKP